MGLNQCRDGKKKKKLWYVAPFCWLKKSGLRQQKPQCYNIAKGQNEGN